jgi:threonine/homoserine/homoserine lactone efflux protein
MSADTIWGFLLLGAGLGISAALSPGPYQSLVIRESLLGGLRRAAPVTFAPLLADIPIAVVLVFLLGQAPLAFLQAVRYGGAALLLYLAWGLWRELRAGDPVEGDAAAKALPAQSAGRGFMLGMMMLFLSPGSYLYWSSVNGPLLLQALDLGLAHALAFLAGFYAFSIGGLLGIAALIERAGQISPAWQRGMRVASLVLLVGVAIWLLASPVS